MVEKSKAKVYQEVLESLRLFIDDNELSPGDRLPSERDLAEKLNAGRSSVREALRAIELLGLIETRHGEGTFLKAYQPYHSVELLSSFILRESKTKAELVELKKLLEQQGAKCAMSTINEQDMIFLKQIISEYDSKNERHFLFFHRIFELTGNSLLLKVWQLIEEFSRTIYTIDYGKEAYIYLLEAFQNNHKNEVDAIIDDIYKFHIK